MSTRGAAVLQRSQANDDLHLHVATAAWRPGGATLQVYPATRGGSVSPWGWPCTRPERLDAGMQFLGCAVKVTIAIAVVPKSSDWHRASPASTDVGLDELASVHCDFADGIGTSNDRIRLVTPMPPVHMGAGDC